VQTKPTKTQHRCGHTKYPTISTSTTSRNEISDYFVSARCHCHHQHSAFPWLVMWPSLKVASRPKFWPRLRSFGLSLASISLSYYIIGYFSCKNRVKIWNFVNFSGNNLKSYVVNHYLVLFHNYFGLGLGLEALASASASSSRLWPRLTSLPNTAMKRNNASQNFVFCNTV